MGQNFHMPTKKDLQQCFGPKVFFPPTPKNSLKVDRKEVGGLALTDEPDRKISVFLTTPLIFLIKPFDRILSAPEEKLGGRT